MAVSRTNRNLELHGNPEVRLRPVTELPMEVDLVLLAMGCARHRPLFDGREPAAVGADYRRHIRPTEQRPFELPRPPLWTNLSVGDDTSGWLCLARWWVHEPLL